MPNIPAVQWPLVNEQRGRDIQRRRLRLDIRSVTAFAKELGVDRETAVRAEAGTASESTYQRIEAWLDRHEEELGFDEPLEPEASTGAAESGLVEFSVGGDFGVNVVVKGPVSNMPELEAAVNRLLDRLRSEGGGTAAASPE